MFKRKPNKMRLRSAMPYTSLFVDSSPDSSGVIHTSLARREVNEVTVPDLPSPENFSIDAYKSSGIPLTKVNPTVLGVPHVDTDVTVQAEQLMNELDPPQVDEPAE